MDDPQPADPLPTRRDRLASGFPVVAIGASAGSLQALRDFFARIPGDSGVAFLLAQHMSAQEGGLFVDLLSRLCAMPVIVAGTGGRVEPNRLHLVPPDMMPGLRDGAFQLRPPRTGHERRAVIDALFRAAAENFGPWAVGIILSGGGTDGVLGLEAIGAEGGMTMAQDPAEAVQGEMPGNAATAGMADHVLPAEDLADRLMAYAAHCRRAAALPDPTQQAKEIMAHVPDVCELLHERTGHDFKHYKTSTVVRRLQRRMQVTHHLDIRSYLDHIAAAPEESQALFRELLIGVTGFFRDPDGFDALTEQVLKPLLARRRAGEDVRIWVPGCATGEEAYSLAILVRELLDGQPSPPTVQIFGTDINQRALAIARRGLYPQGIASQMSPGRLERFFTRHGRRFQVMPEIRELCLFATHSLIGDPPFSRLDLISCRNVLIYLGPHLQKKLVSVFHYALRRDGCLFLGLSETLGGHAELFRPVDPRHRLWQRKDTGVKTGGSLDLGRSPPSGRILPAMPEPDLAAIAQRIVLDEFAPKYAIVGEDGRIVLLSDGVDAYIQLPAGTFSNNVAAMVRPGLRVVMRAAFKEAVKNRRMVIQEAPAVKTSRGLRRIRLTVQPMPELGRGDGMYMLVFHDLGEGGDTVIRKDGERTIDAEVEQLEHELFRMREDLERTVQDLEAANEELKSSNEELQSANEELETSKEDVQAANQALANANADLENLLRSTGIATIFLDSQLRIRGFTPMAATLYNLIASDVGRPLGHLTHRFMVLPPLPDLGEVLGGDGPIEHESRTLDGNTLLRRVLPYRTGDGRADGMVVSFIDITSRKHAQVALAASEQRLKLALSAGKMASWDWDARTETLRWDLAQSGLLGLDDEAEPLTGDRFATLVHPDDRDGFRQAIRDAMSAGGEYRAEFRIIRPDGEMSWLASRGTAYHDEDGLPLRLAGVTYDISERKQADAALRASEERFRAIFEHASVGIKLVSAAEGRLLAVNPRLCSMLGCSAEELTALTYRDIALPEDLPAEEEKVRQLLAGEVDSFDLEMRHQCKNHRPIWVRLSSSLVGDPNSADTYRISVVENITARKLAEQALRDSEFRLRAMFEHAAVGIKQVSVADGRILAANPRLCGMLGYTAEELTGLSYRDIAAPEDLAEEERLVSLLLGGEVASFALEMRHRRKNGGRIWVRLSSSMVGTPDQPDAYRISVIEDITGRKRTEQALLQRTEELQAVMDAVPALVWIAEDPESRRITGSRAAHTFLRLPVGANLSLSAPAEERPTHFRTLRDGVEIPVDDLPVQRAARGFEVRDFEYDVVFDDGARHHLIGNATPLRDDDGALRGSVAAFVDITPFKQAEAARRETELRLRMLIDANPIGVFQSDIHGQIFEANDALLRIVGYAREDLAAGRMRWTDMTPPDWGDATRRALAEARERGVCTPYEKEYLRKDGTRVPVLIGYALLGESREQASAFILDLSDRKQAEEGLKAALAEKTSLLEQRELLLREVNHRIKNSLQLVSSMLHLQTHSAGPELRQQLAQANRRVLTVAKVHEQLYKQPQLLNRIEFAQYLRNLASSLEQTVGDTGQQISVRIDADRAEIATDRVVSLALAVNELVTNASKYAFRDRMDGRITVTFRVMPDGSQRLSVADDGQGLPEGFSPQRSAGLGMKVVLGLVHGLGATLDIDSSEHGTAFTIVMPAPEPR